MMLPAGLDLDADISALRGATYNPRRIGEEDLDALADSLRTLGLVKPLIVRGDLLVAGHQRTKALRRLGVTRAAVYRLPAATTLYDEIRFNQLHNGTDLDAGDEAATIPAGLSPGWHVIEGQGVKANLRGKLAVVRREIALLIGRYGPWGGIVATTSGEVIHAAQYAIAARLTRSPLTVHVVAPENETAARGLLGRSYGVFDYGHLKRATYIQTLAQPYRLRGKAAGNSRLYDKSVLPWLEANPSARVLDFGSGQGDYAAALRRRGFNVHDVELFRRAGGKMALDRGAVHRMIDRLCEDLATHGPYDAVVCDCVLNSVDCLEAERAVAVLLNAFTKPGGPLFVSSRPRETRDTVDNRTIMAEADSSRRGVEFIDANGFSALYRQGHWFYQKFHDRPGFEALLSSAGFQADHYRRFLTTFQVRATKVRDLPAADVVAACEYEFNLPLGDAGPIGRAADVRKALGC
ncbi:MAG: ParB N-terminal domain-containing protein [Xanthobacteraceae bacterium]